jgi:hypothetical protein
MEGPYNGIPGPDPGDDDTPPSGNVRQNYNMELIGYFYPPKDGNIMLAIATDDPGELYLSTDEDPANKKLIATETQWNPVRSFFGAFDPSADPPTAQRRSIITCGDAPVPRPENWSAFITVTKGKPYFIQAIGTEYGGGDNTAVAFRYEGDPDFADGDKPISGQYLSPFAVSAKSGIATEPQDAAAYVGSTATFSIGLDIPPGATLTSIKWTKNGTDVADSDTNKLTVAVAAADNNAKFKAIATASDGTLTSREATLSVCDISNDFALGVVKFEAWTGITGTAVSGLLDDPHFQDPPDDKRLLGGIDSPNAYGDNYGARITGFVIPPTDGDYRFFIRSDDASQFLLSPDSDPAKAVMIAEETGCCDAFHDPGDPETSEPQTLKAGTKYAFITYVKEGGGGDYVQVAWRKEGDTTPASALRPLSGSVLGANAKPTCGEAQITQQPQGLPQLQEGRTGRLSVDGIVTPAAFSFPLLVKWQKNGADIPGAISKTYIIPSATAADSGTYRAVVSSPGGTPVNSSDAVVAVVPDTFPPVPTAGAFSKGGKQEIGVGFDEDVKLATANVLANYSLSAGTIDSMRVVNRPATGFDATLNIPEYNGIVLVASGLTAGQSYQLTVKNVEDLKGNKIPAAGAVATFKADDQKTWSVVGKDENGFANDAVRIDDGSFDVVSSGVAFWADYDEATFVNQKVNGDFDAKVQLIDQDPSSQWARTGLMAREALDEGKGRPVRPTDSTGAFDPATCTYVLPKEQLFSRLQTVHANAAIRADAGVSNNGFENHYRDETTYAMTWGNQMQSVGVGVVPEYPNVWMRLKREGNSLITYRSSDAQNWIQMSSRSFPKLAADLFVGPFYAPELDNNPITDTAPGGIDDLLKHSVVAKFRNYSITTTTGPPPTGSQFTGISLQGGNVVFTWTGTGTLQSADAVTGPYADVAGAASPRTVPVANGPKYYRFKP